MTTIGEIRLYLQPGPPNSGVVIYASRMPDGKPGSYSLELPRYALPELTAYIDVKIGVESEKIAE
jgi:hypothetical protein